MATRAKKNSPAAVSQAQAAPTNVEFVDLHQIRTLPQVRTEFDEASIAELAASIKSFGVLQPILLRPQAEWSTVEGKPIYLVIAGERRFRAAQAAGLTHIPAIVGQVDDETAATMQLVENIQREELSLKDTAAGILALYEKHKALAPVATLVGKSVPWVSKHITAATKLKYHTAMLLEKGEVEDLELLLILSQIEGGPMGWKHIDEIIEAIREKKAGRTEARALLEQLRTEDVQRKADAQAEQKRRQGELTLNAEARKEPEWDASEALQGLENALDKPDHAPISELVAAFNAKQRKAMLDIDKESWKLGQQHQSKGIQLARTMARLAADYELPRDVFGLAAFLLGATDVALSLEQLATEAHYVMHGTKPKA
jgi:ParB family chromosome partitioning protein